MNQKTEAQAPKVELATKDWTLNNNQTRCMVGLIITMTIAIIVAVLFQG